MDGLLIDSEPLWQEAQLEAFKKVGIELNKDLCLQTMGLRVDKVVDYWHEKYPWENYSKKEIEDEILKNVIKLVKEKGAPRNGVEYILNYVKSKGVKIALASSSPMILIKETVKKLGVENYFEELYSAEFEEYGKPHPGVYITASKMLDVSAESCIAFEDSFNGLLSAKSAMMKCVCVPDESLIGNAKLGVADIVLSSLLEFNDLVWDNLDR